MMNLKRVWTTVASYHNRSNGSGKKVCGFIIDDCEMFAFCSLSDSDHSPWLEYETAKLLNPKSQFQQFVADYSTACDGDGYDEAEFKTVPFYRVYKKLLKTLSQE